MKMEHTECSETSAYKFQTPGNHPKESIQYSVHGESFKSRFSVVYYMCCDITASSEMPPWSREEGNTF